MFWGLYHRTEQTRLCFVMWLVLFVCCREAMGKWNSQRLFFLCKEGPYYSSLHIWGRLSCCLTVCLCFTMRMTCAAVIFQSVATSVCGCVCCCVHSWLCVGKTIYCHVVVCGSSQVWWLSDGCLASLPGTTPELQTTTDEHSVPCVYVTVCVRIFLIHYMYLTAVVTSYLSD